MVPPRIVLLGLALLLAVSSCRRKEPRVPTNTPEEALAQLVAAARAGRLDRLFELLDKNSRWSLMSVRKSRRRICDLVRAHYPKERQGTALRRCHSAERARDVKTFFVAHVEKYRAEVLGPLLRFKPPGRRIGSGARVELESQGQRLAFCKADGQWWYCELQERFGGLKLKSVRDLTTVQENVEAYK